MATVYDNTRPASQGGGYIEWDGPLDNSPGGWLTELERRRQQAMADHARSVGRWKTADKFAFAAAAVPFGFAAAPYVATAFGAGAPSASAGTGATTATTASTAGGSGGGMGVQSFLTNLLKDPQTYRDIGSLFSGGAKGAANERGNQNSAINDANRNAISEYGIQQNSLLSSLLAQSNEATNRYGTAQGATTAATQGLQNATTNALNSQSAEGLQRAQLGLQAPSVRARQSVMGSLMKNLQPTHIQGPAGQAGHETQITGGMNASALDPTTRQHGDELMKAALMAQMSGSDVPAATDFKSGIQDWKSSVLDAPAPTDYSKGLLAPPRMQGYQQPGSGESLMAGGGMLGSILGELLKLKPQSSEQPSDTAGWG